MIKVEYSDFIKLCQVDDPANWVSWLKIEPDGVWINTPASTAFCTPTERAVLSAALNESGELTKPAISFPCSLEQLQVFLENAGVYGCIDPFDMADFIQGKTGKAKDESPQSHCSDLPLELKIAILVYEEFWKDRPKNMNPTPEKDITAFIKKQTMDNISKSAIERIRTIARPGDEKGGGAPVSDRPIFKGHSQKKQKTP